MVNVVKKNGVQNAKIDCEIIMGLRNNENEENLKNMVGQDIDALENIQKKNYYKAIKKYNRNAAQAAKK